MDLPEIERLPGETPRAFQAAKIYIMMGPERSLTKTSQKLEKNRTTIDQWSRRYNWVRRALLYDTEVDKRELAELSHLRTKQLKVTLRRRIEVRNNDWAAAQALRARSRDLMSMPTHRVKNIKLIEVTQEMVDKGEKIAVEIHMLPAGWRQSDIARLEDTASKLERLATDQPTENIDIHTETPEESAEKLLQLAKSAYSDLCREYPTVAPVEIAERIARRYGVEPQFVISTDSVN